MRLENRPRALANAPILLTSFCPWKAHQTENSSDVLLANLMQRGTLPANTCWLGQLPVNFELAPLQVIAQIYTDRPKLVICCGMAESRPMLTVERWGKSANQQLATHLDLTQLVQDTIHTQISEDAGNYVCNHLYYRILRYLEQQSLPCHALFIHVPRLTNLNRALIEFDFLRIVRRLNQI